MLSYIPPSWWIVVRSMTVASEDNPIISLCSHLSFWILSLREMQKKWIVPKYSNWWSKNMYTPDNEISVYDWNEFQYEAKNSDSSWWHHIAILLPRAIASNSSINNIQVDHPVIKDEIPVWDRIIEWIWINSQIWWLFEKVQKAILEITTSPIPIITDTYKFWQFIIISK